MNSKELLKSFLIMISLNGSSSIIKEWDIAWMICDNLHPNIMV